jgi:hypothetical protein
MFSLVKLKNSRPDSLLVADVFKIQVTTISYFVTSVCNRRIMLATLASLLLVTSMLTWACDGLSVPKFEIFENTTDHRLDVGYGGDHDPIREKASRTLSLRSSLFHNSIRSLKVNPSACIGTDADLRKAVSALSTDRSKPATMITLCSRIKISKAKNAKNETGIDLSRKNIEFRCLNTRGRRCVLDGQSASRIFYGNGTTLKLNSFDFINGNVVPLVDKNGYDRRDYASALAFGGNSSIVVNQCSFRNNRNGTIYVVDSVVTLRGNSSSPMIFFNNTANAYSALYAVRSTVRAMTGYISFRNNTGDRTVFTTVSDTAMRGVTFDGNKGLVCFID